MENAESRPELRKERKTSRRTPSAWRGGYACPSFTIQGDRSSTLYMCRIFPSFARQRGPGSFSRDRGRRSVPHTGSTGIPTPARFQSG